MRFFIFPLAGVRWLLLIGACCWSATAAAQQPRVRLLRPQEDGVGRLAQGGATTQPAPPQILPSDNNLAPVQPAPATTAPGSAPGATLQSPTFDPFATQPGTTPAPAVQPGAGGPVYGQPLYPPTNPGATFPGGMSWSPSWRPQQYLKVLDDLRFRHTWLAGDTGISGRELDINDLEIAFTLNLPNFMHTGQPLHFSPGFMFHFWQGPRTTAPALTELPSRAYSGYVELDWRTNPQNQFGVEFDAFGGVFSDFENTTASVRVFGTGLGWWRLTNNFAVKAGAVYLDRLDKKLLPAAGFFWQPSDMWNLEVYFPSPRIERYLWMIGNTHLWLYLGGEYGGGSWSIRHDDAAHRAQPAGGNDQVDINDIRVFSGLKWFRSPTAGIRGFAEVGWVFDREIIFRWNPADNLKLKDTFMLRGGFTF